MVVRLTKEKIDNINSMLIILTLYIGILTYPLTNITGNSTALWLAIGAVLFISIYINKSINLKFIYIVLFFVIFFIINYLSVDYKYLVAEEFLNFFRSGILMLYLSSQVVDYKSLIKWWYKISILSFIICNVFLNYFIKNNLYMDFGIFMTYNFIIFCTYLYKNYNEKVILNLVLVTICFLEIIIFANRSSMLICIFTIIYYEIINFNKKNAHIKILKLSILALSSIFVFININEILKKLINSLNNMGIYSYSLTKIILSLQNGFVAESSGRDDILHITMNIVKNSHYMPNGVRYLDYITNGGYLYTHNIFTDILITFGIVGLVLFLLFIIYITYKKYIYSKYNEDFKYISSIIYIYLATRLTFSSTFWKESLFWMLIGIVIFYKGNFKRMDIKVDSKQKGR